MRVSSEKENRENVANRNFLANPKSANLVVDAVERRGTVEPRPVSRRSTMASCDTGPKGFRLKPEIIDDGGKTAIDAIRYLIYNARKRNGTGIEEHQCRSSLPLSTDEPVRTTPSE